MPVNPEAVGARGEPRKASWDPDACLLYALGIGAGVSDPVNEELEFTTENTMGVEQKVFPTFAVVAGFNGKGS